MENLMVSLGLVCVNVTHHQYANGEHRWYADVITTDNIIGRAHGATFEEAVNAAAEEARYRVDSLKSRAVNAYRDEMYARNK